MGAGCRVQHPPPCAPSAPPSAPPCQPQGRRVSGWDPSGSTSYRCARGTWGAPSASRIPWELPPPPFPVWALSGSRPPGDMAGTSCPHITAWVGGTGAGRAKPPPHGASVQTPARVNSRVPTCHCARMHACVCVHTRALPRRTAGHHRAQAEEHGRTRGPTAGTHMACCGPRPPLALASGQLGPQRGWERAGGCTTPLPSIG